MGATTAGQPPGRAGVVAGAGTASLVPACAATATRLPRTPAAVTATERREWYTLTGSPASLPPKRPGRPPREDPFQEPCQRPAVWDGFDHSSTERPARIASMNSVPVDQLRCTPRDVL